MTRKLGLLLTILLLLLMTVIGIHAQADSIAGMARYFPDDVDFFFAMRTDEAFVDEVDTLTAPLFERVTRVQPDAPSSLREFIGLGLQGGNLPLDSLLTWMGDEIAFAMVAPDVPGSSPTDGYFVAEIDNRAEAEAFLAENLPSGQYTQTSQGTFTVFESNGGSVALSDNLLIIYTEHTNGYPQVPDLRIERSLESDSDFTSAIDSLSAERYNILFYIDPVAFPQQTASASAFQVSAENTGPLAVGFTILDGDTLTIDTAQLPGSTVLPTHSPVDPDFARFIPASANAVVHATNLAGLYDGLITMLKDSTSANAPDPEEQISGALGMMGIDLREDFLSWAVGDYALFAQADLMPVVQVLASQSQIMPDLNGLFNFGLVIEATDPEGAQAFAAKMDTLLQQITAQNREINIGTETINGIEVTAITVVTPLAAGNLFELDILMGANEDVFFLVTRPLLNAVLSGDGVLSSSETFADAGQYLLENPSSVWYADGPGAIYIVGGIGGIVPLALLGPAIGNVFDNIVANLQESGTPMPTPTPLPTATPVFTEDEIVAEVESALNSVRHSTISATVTDDGIAKVRLTFTFER